MKDLTVKQLAVVSGVTVRALHHYDEIGLLKPASVGENGYRYYGRTELLRLQRILFYRELGVPLNEIAELLVVEGGDEIGVLLRHREKLAAKRQRYAQLIETIDRTVAELKGGAPVSNTDLYKGFSADKQAEYEAWLIERYGEPMRADIERGRKAFAKLSPTKREVANVAASKELQQLEEALAEGFRRGLEPGSEAVDVLIARHRAWVAMMWARPCSAEAYLGLANLYLSHPDFVMRYERIEKGFANYLTEAMKAHVARI